MSCCSLKFSALLTENGEIWTFGTSDSGVLGHEEKNFYVVPEPRMVNDIDPMVFICAGPAQMMAITSHSSRRLWAWGNNLYGQLGIQVKKKQEIDEKTDNNNQE
jgi:alpha-tubulin suppressor-like RCC1 family protein